MIQIIIHKKFRFYLLLPLHLRPEYINLKLRDDGFSDSEGAWVGKPSGGTAGETLGVFFGTRCKDPAFEHLASLFFCVG